MQRLQPAAARLHSCSLAAGPPVHLLQLRRTPQPARRNTAAYCSAIASAAGVSSSNGRAVLPVTVLSGFLGAGKTTLLRHVLSSNHGLRIAVLVNDLADVNIDTRLVAAVAANSAGDAGTNAARSLVALSNGCICCNIREDLVREVRALAEQRAFDYLLVESTGVSLPLPVAATFAMSEGPGYGTPSLSDIARLDTLVTVVDAQRFVGDVMAAQSLHEVGQAVDGEDDRTVADLLVEQVECADVLVLNKTDLVTNEQLLQLQQLLATLNPSAKVISTQHGRVHPSELLSTGRFSMEKVQTAPGWLQQLSAFEQEQQQHQQHQEEATSSSGRRQEDIDTASTNGSQQPAPTSSSCGPGTHHQNDSARSASTSSSGRHDHDHHHHHHNSAHGISSFVYYARRPFHPQRLMDTALSVQWRGVLRSKGFFWLATRHDVMGLWQSAGGAWQGEPSAIWNAALPPSERPDDVDASSWHPTWGDRCQELVWIGIGMDEAGLRAMLDECLLTDEEMAVGPEGWAAFEDPLPEWLDGGDQETWQEEEGEEANE